MRPKNYDSLTEKQKSCCDMLAEWAGGYHHLPKVHEFGEGICINFSQDLSTYDWTRLTMLVLLAHARAVRIEITGSGPRMVKIIAHQRKPKEVGMAQWERHPTLLQLRNVIEDMLSREPKP